MSAPQAAPWPGLRSDSSGALPTLDLTSIVIDRSFQTDARAQPARPDIGTASGALGGPRSDSSGALPTLDLTSIVIDQSFQTDARAKPGRPACRHRKRRLGRATPRF